MPPLKVLICGGGCAGPALAYWLALKGHKVVICERWDALRASGAQIDLRAQGIDVARRMGLLDIIRSKVVDEEGVSLVDSKGNIKATLMANKSGKGAQTLSSEYEIMRGDLVRILYDATKDNVEYLFGKTVERFDQDNERVVAYFSDHTSDTFDLLVGADGQGSRIRKAILPSDCPDPHLRLGVYMAYWFVPREERDINIQSFYHSTGGRIISRRSSTPNETQVYLSLRDDSKALRSMPRAPIEQQKEFWSQRFRDAGWQTDRFLERLKTTENFYCQEILQIRTDTWHKGRVVLLGDAAHCASPFKGMGTTGALVGAYVLAGEISRSTEDLSQALANYDRRMRPFAKEMQNISPWLMRLMLPETRWGIAILHFIVGLLCFLRIPDIVARMLPKEEHGSWKLPDYPELRQR